LLSLFHTFTCFMLVYWLQMWDLYRREVISEKVDIWVSHLFSYYITFWFNVIRYYLLYYWIAIIIFLSD
jgi:hypothetical protein